MRCFLICLRRTREEKQPDILQTGDRSEPAAVARPYCEPSDRCHPSHSGFHPRHRCQPLFPRPPDRAIAVEFSDVDRSTVSAALEPQLGALSSLLGVDVPPRMRTRFIPHLQHWRSSAQARLPLLRQGLLPETVLNYRNDRDGLGASNRQRMTIGNRKWRLPKSDTLRFLLALSRKRRVGKI
jgi:hypothetical protein